MRADERRDRWLLAALAAVLAWRVLAWLVTGSFNEDELENVQVLWLFHHGVVFGRDYVTSHLPTFAFLLEPLYRWKGPSPELPGAVRIALVPMVAWTLAELHALGSRVSGWRLGGIVTIVGVLASPTLAVSLSEARPDALALPLALAGLRLFDRHARERGSEVRDLAHAGLCFGASLLMNPKAMFLFLATLWAADRHHARDRALGASERHRWLAIFASAALAPLAVAIGALAAAGIVGRADVEVFLTTGYRWLDPVGLLDYKRFLLGRIVALAPAPWLIGAWALLRDRPRAAGAREPGWDAVWLAALAYLGQMTFSAVLVTQMLLLPAALLAAAATRVLRGRSTATTLLVCLVTVIVPAVSAPEDRGGRDEQVARWRYVLDHVAEDRPVLDGRFGSEAFRPLAGRFQQYRPWIYRPEVFAEEEARVVAALAERRFGAVVAHPNFALIPAEVRAVIERNYAPVDRADVWLPRAGG
ncbi:MAG: hypothetical protein IPK07_08885 [Deltaproteobacteria bacterium]|nr:hypothetical protein [Deltaproteobacteria bacterium]